MNKTKVKKESSFLNKFIVYVWCFIMGCCVLAIAGALIYGIYLFIDLKVNGGPMYFTIEYQENRSTNNDARKTTFTSEIDKETLAIYVNQGYITEPQMDKINEVLGGDRVQLIENEKKQFVFTYKPPVSKSITDCDKKRIVEKALKTVNPNLYGRIYNYQRIETRCSD